jgi:hypothetical protein
MRRIWRKYRRLKIHKWMIRCLLHLIANDHKPRDETTHDTEARGFRIKVETYDDFIAEKNKINIEES